MIDPVASLVGSLPPKLARSGPADEPAATFDAALAAAMAAERRQEERRREMEAIREKGFSNWVRDTQIEKLREELRRKAMAAMGVSEDDVAGMGDEVRRLVEQKIEEEIERMLRENASGGEDKPRSRVAADPSAERDHPPGRNCPVIPALVWPGGASVF